MRDPHCNVFALELIDEKHYLNGRFIDGEYFADVQAENLRGVRLNHDSFIGLEFTGLVKIREFVFGYEWGGLTAHKNLLLNALTVKRLRNSLQREFDEYSKRYKDVHERNVMLGLRSSKEKGMPLTMSFQHPMTKKTTYVKKKFSVRLRGIDLR